MTRSRVLIALGGLTISAIFLWLAVRDADPEAVRDALGSANVGLVLLASLAFGVYHHYLVVSPDHVAHLPAGSPAAQSRFVWSAGTIAVLEALAVLYGALRIRWLGARAGKAR